MDSVPRRQPTPLHPSIRVTEGLLKTAGQFLHLVDPPCERMVCVTDVGVTVFPAYGASIEDQVEMVRRAGRFLDTAPMTRMHGDTAVSYGVRGVWAEVEFTVKTTFAADPLEELIRRDPHGPTPPAGELAAAVSE